MNLMRGLTKNIGKSQHSENLNPINKDNIKRVLINRPNHRLGNQLLITPLIQEIEDTFPNSTIDLFVKGGLAPIIFKNYNNIDRLILLPKKPFKNLIQYFMVWYKIKNRRYDLVINVDKNSSSGRLSTQFANADYKFFGLDYDGLKERYEDYIHIAKYPVYNFREFLSLRGIPKNNHKIPCMDLKLSAEELATGNNALAKLADPNKKTICLFTFATGAKCYSETWWAALYEELKNQYEDLNIIEILPVENVSQIGFKAPVFYSKDIREMGALMANVTVFVGADSGIMHLASAVNAPTVGLFSVTNTSMYQPFNENSLAINTNNTDNDAIISAIDRIITAS
jgi:ADP-heptose:LPS heptosyltransferase